MRFNHQLFVQRTFTWSLAPRNGRKFHLANFQFLVPSPLRCTKINRYLSGGRSLSSSRTLPDRMEDVRREFALALENVVLDLTETGRKVDPDVSERYGKLLRYNVPGGKENRVLTLIESYRHFTLHSSRPDESRTLAYVMACCIEMLHVFFLFVDDLQDGAHHRRGQRCWHRLEGNKTMANNDAVMLESGIYATLGKYFRDKPYYVAVLEMFHEMTSKVTMGQCLDMLIMKSFHDTKKLQQFTANRYRTLVSYKTADYSFYFPVALPMYMAGITDLELHRQTRDILIEVGVLFQIQDDYLNYFGDPKLLGKEGNDIAFGRCTWPIVVALQNANARQKDILEKCYGKSDENEIQAVKNVYKELDLPKIFAAHEDETRGHLVARIEALPKYLPREVIFKTLDQIYKRRF